MTVPSGVFSIMSDRIADDADELRVQVLELAERCDGDQETMLQRAANELEGVAKIDREKHGDTPTDKLVEFAEASGDRCAICGEPTDGAVFCSLSCLQENGGADD
jgi:hypothetical protein